MLGRRRHHAALGLACVAVLLSAASASAEEQLPAQPVTEVCAGPSGEGEGQRVCGTLNPHVNERVGYHFAYNAGAECTGGAMTPAGQEVEGEGIAVSAQLAGLAPETTYSYCLVATNEFGESVGEALSFRTPGPSSTTADYTPGGPGPRSDVAFGSASLVGPLVLGAPGPAKRLARAMRACRRMPVRQRARCRRHARARYQRAHGRSERAAAPS
ncbi:MAG TPA: hypothetical protein VFM94_01750 [Solirubrobacterales bacterium]|nr:hypothetical protein [Solirubrobacterales bacterium]